MEQQNKEMKEEDYLTPHIGETSSLFDEKYNWDPLWLHIRRHTCCIKDLNRKSKTTMLIKENIWEYVCDLTIGKDFF